jgi:hypothetical protein
MASLMAREGAFYLLSFGLGMVVLRLVQSRFDRDDGDNNDDNDDSDDSDDDVDDDEDEQQQQQQQQLAGLTVRDDYTSDEPYKMLLICNMELYKQSSKTGEVGGVHGMRTNLTLWNTCSAMLSGKAGQDERRQGRCPVQPRHSWRVSAWRSPLPQGCAGLAADWPDENHRWA